jgi:uncharacterized membrane protein HdeD (DUF308 family)
MSDKKKSKVSEITKSSMPWRKGIAWWVVLIEGIVLVIMGLFMFFATTKTYTIIGWMIGLILLISGLLSLFASLRLREAGPRKKWRQIQGIVGIVSGLVVIILLLLDVFLKDFGLILLGVGCLVYGGVGVYIIVNKDVVGLRHGPILSTLLYLLLGILVLLQAFNIGALETTISIINLIILVAGFALILWAFILKRESNNESPSNTVQ